MSGRVRMAVGNRLRVPSEGPYVGLSPGRGGEGAHPSKDLLAASNTGVS